MSPSDVSFRRRVAFVAVLFTWAVGFGIHAWLHVANALAIPEAVPEVYARTVGFQLAVFAYLYGLFWIVGLVVTLFGIRTYWPRAGQK